MSEYEDEISSSGAICPYCQTQIHIECEDYSEESRIEECPNCEKKFWQNEYFTVDHETSPDCELNGEQHDYQPFSLKNGIRNFCEICGKIEPL